MKMGVMGDRVVVVVERRRDGLARALLRVEREGGFGAFGPCWRVLGLTTSKVAYAYLGSAHVKGRQRSNDLVSA